MTGKDSVSVCVCVCERKSEIKRERESKPREGDRQSDLMKTTQKTI